LTGTTERGRRRYYGPGVEITRVITCPDCGGRAHLVQEPDDDDEIGAGDVLAYRCEDCLDRWDVVVEEEEDGAES
jgi:hypothetical protein